MTYCKFNQVSMEIQPTFQFLARPQRPMSPQCNRSWETFEFIAIPEHQFLQVLQVTLHSQQRVKQRAQLHLAIQLNLYASLIVQDTTSTVQIFLVLAGQIRATLQIRLN